MNPAATMANAISAYTSQNYGAKRYERIIDGIKFGLKMVTGFYVVLGGVMIFFPANLARVLLSGKDQIELVCIFLPACGIMLIFLNISVEIKNSSIFSGSYLSFNLNLIF